MDVMGFTTASSTDAARVRARWMADKRVSSSVLHRDTKATVDMLETIETVAVTHYNEVQCYLVSPEGYGDLVEQASRAVERDAELKTALPMMLAAARAGVAIPSETLDRLVPGYGTDDWRELAEFAAAFPVTFATGEHGEPVTRARLSTVSGPIEESGTDEDLNLD